MHPLKSGLAAAGTLLAMALPQAAGQPSAARPKRNVVIFVADGLRHDSVTAEETPALWRVRTEGVHFRNSYALFPTFTTANASAIATGHGLGDTGDFSNTLWLGHALFDGGNFNQGAGTPVSFIENDQILGDLSEHHGGNYLGRDTLVALARKHGYRTAVVGKVGPAAIQDPGLVTPNGGVFPPPSPSAIVVDDATGTGGAPALPPQLVAALQRLDIPTEAPARSNGYGATSRYNNGFSGDRTTAGTMSANVVQQQWFADVTTRAILPLLTDQADAPFLLVFWSRDPDGTQHNQGDSLNTLFPGINGDTSHLAVRNADRALQQLLEWLSAHPDIAANTDVVVTSDHGFATVSRREIDRQGHPTASEAAKHFYVDAAGRVDTDRGMLPQGFLAIDLSLSLHLELFDPDRRAPLSSAFPYARVRLDFDTWEHPANGNGLLGADVRRLDGADARAIVAANGGSDLIYVPDGNRDVVSRIAETLA